MKEVASVMPAGRSIRLLRQCVLSLSLLTALAACSLGPDYRRPDLDIPDQYNGPAEPTAGWPSGSWWRGFGSSELDSLIAEAETANFDLAAAVARVRQAEAQAQVTGAPLYPAISASAGVSRQQQPVLSSQSQFRGRAPSQFRGRASSTTTNTIYNAVGSTSYEIDFWGKNQANLEAAEDSAQASRFDQQVVALTVVTDVATAYFQILATQDQLRIAQENLVDAERILQIIQGRQAFGTATALDEAQQQTLVATQQAAIAPLQQQLEQSINSLATLIGRPPESIHVADGSLADVKIPLVSPGLPSQLLERRPDVRETEAQLMAANADIKAARAAFFPSVQLTAQGGFESLALSSLLGPANTLSTLAVSATQPIFEGGQLRGQLDLQKGRYEELLQGYRKAVVAAFVDVENALIAAQRTAEQEQLQRAAVQAARRAYDLSEARLRAGTVDLVTVLTAEQSLFNAQNTSAQVRLVRFQAAVSLFKALGGGWT